MNWPATAIIAAITAGILIFALESLINQPAITPVITQRPVNNGLNAEALIPNQVYFLYGWQQVKFSWKSHYSTYIFEYFPKPKEKTKPIDLTFEEVRDYISAEKEI